MRRRSLLFSSTFSCNFRLGLDLFESNPFIVIESSLFFSKKPLVVCEFYVKNEEYILCKCFKVLPVVGFNM